MTQSIYWVTYYWKRKRKLYIKIGYIGIIKRDDERLGACVVTLYASGFSKFCNHFRTLSDKQIGNLGQHIIVPFK